VGGHSLRPDRKRPVCPRSGVFRTQRVHSSARSNYPRGHIADDSVHLASWGTARQFSPPVVRAGPPGLRTDRDGMPIVGASHTSSTLRASAKRRLRQGATAEQPRRVQGQDHPRNGRHRPRRHERRRSEVRFKLQPARQARRRPGLRRRGSATATGRTRHPPPHGRRRSSSRSQVTPTDADAGPRRRHATPDPTPTPTPTRPTDSRLNRLELRCEMSFDQTDTLRCPRHTQPTLSGQGGGLKTMELGQAALLKRRR